MDEDQAFGSDTGQPSAAVNGWAEPTSALDTVGPLETLGASDAVDDLDPVATDRADATQGGSELDLEMLAQIEQELADVERALERLGDGSYGSCETCGESFTDDELETAPARRYCRAHLPLDLP